MLRKSLLSLALGTFALGISEFGMMGILSVIAHNMDISIPDTGNFISAYSLGVACGAPCLIFLNRFSIKKILLGLCAIIVLGNSFTAMAGGYYSLLAGRFISGVPHGIYFGVGAILATRLVGYGEKATAVAIMVSGMSFANVVGVPLATWMSESISWRLAFVFVALAAASAFMGIWREIPAQEAQASRKRAQFTDQFKFLKSRAPWLIFAGTLFGQGAMYCWYSYVEPIMLNIAHVPPAYITFVMMIAGMGMVVGNLLAGRLADKYRPGLVTAIICILEIPILLLIYLYSEYTVLAIILTFIGAGQIFAVGGPLQYLMIKYSPGGEMLGGAAIQIAFNVSNAISAWLGGCVIGAGFGLTSPALAGIPLAALAAACMFYFHKKFIKTA